MKHFSSLAIACTFFAPLAVMGQTTIFSDNFSTSTLDTANTTPTATSTGYQIASTKATAGSTIGAGDLKITFPSTSSGIAEIQALFTTSPITLATVGDSIHLNVTFADTSGLLPAGSSFLSGGLYNSGGAAPVNNGQLASSGINATASSPFANGNAQGWVGYIGRINGTGANSQIATRPAQTGTATTTSVRQELVGNNFSSSGGYNDPAGVSLHSAASTVVLTTSATYNYDFTITLSAVGTLTIADSLTTTGTTPTTLFSDTTTATGANLIATTFDGFAFGDRASAAGAANTLDISQIIINDQITATPEPTTLALTGIGIAGLLGMRRFRK